MIPLSKIPFMIEKENQVVGRPYEQVVAELDAKIPRENVSTRDAGGGRRLSYLEGHYVIDRLNKVLGQLNWQYQVEELRLVHSGQQGDKYVAHYLATVHLSATIGDRSVYFTEVGYGDGQDRSSPGKPHELAAKEAVTDGLKRAAKNLGMSMGLALYDKEQSNVEEAVINNRTEAPRAESRPAPRSSGDGGANDNKQSGTEKEKILKSITVASRVIIDKKVATISQLQEKLTSFGVQKKEDLTLAQAKDFLTQLSAML